MSRNLELTVGSGISIAVVAVVVAFATLAGGLSSLSVTSLIFVISIPLAFLSTMLCRNLIDWKGLQEKEEELESLKENMREQNGLSDSEKEELGTVRSSIWEINMKQSLFYLAVFVLFSGWLAYAYSDVGIAQLPFDIGSVELLGISASSLGFFVWFLLTYFGFSYFWRNMILER